MMKIRKLSTEIEISIPWTTARGSVKTIYVYVYDNGAVNVAATSEMNDDGFSALKDALAVAEVIKRRGLSM